MELLVTKDKEISALKVKLVFLRLSLTYRQSECVLAKAQLKSMTTDFEGFLGRVKNARPPPQGGKPKTPAELIKTPSGKRFIGQVIVALDTQTNDDELVQALADKPQSAPKGLWRQVAPLPPAATTPQLAPPAAGPAPQLQVPPALPAAAAAAPQAQAVPGVPAPQQAPPAPPQAAAHVAPANAQPPLTLNMDWFVDRRSPYSRRQLDFRLLVCSLYLFVLTGRKLCTTFK
jgi:hypothetical protein